MNGGAIQGRVLAESQIQVQPPFKMKVGFVWFGFAHRQHLTWDLLSDRRLNNNVNWTFLSVSLSSGFHLLDCSTLQIHHFRDRPFPHWAVSLYLDHYAAGLGVPCSSHRSSAFLEIILRCPILTTGT